MEVTLLSLLIALLCICVFLFLLFWMLGLVLNSIPGAPPVLRGLIIGVVALICLIWLLGGYSPFYAHSIFLRR
jgi:hypothetical protein